MIAHPEIPQGHYCYTIDHIEYGPPTPETTKLVQIFNGDEDAARSIVRMVTKPCPHWGLDPDRADGDNGFCRLTGHKDWEDGGLLWDQVKGCGINMESDDEPLS